MKLIDQTPLQDENGEIGFVQRVQGSLKYGFNWYPELQAQKSVLTHLSRVLGKNFTVIRNQTLGASGITVPLVLVGPAGIYAAFVTHLTGTYQAKGDSWGQMFGVSYQPAKINLITRTQLLAKAIQAFIERQGVKLPKPVEPVILAANPALHIESMQPAVRIILVDALERWATSIENAAPVFTAETAYELADRIVNPRPPKKEEPEVAAKPVAQPREEVESLYGMEESRPFEPGELEFAFQEDENLEALPEQAQSRPVRPKAAAKKRILGMTPQQLALLGGMALIEMCLLIGFILIISFNS